jgi:ribulose 1,5-bisphosphate carboxylase large subunit-like protein
MSWEKSEVMREFLKIASEQGLIKEALPEKNPYQEDLKTIEEKRLKPAEKSIIEEAHPEPVYVAESKGDGGLVENQLEQQKKIIQMINKMPTGSIVGRYAHATAVLVKLAGDFDDIGEFDLANLLTDVAGKLTHEMANMKSDTKKLVQKVDTATDTTVEIIEELHPFTGAPNLD